MMHDPYTLNNQQLRKNLEIFDHDPLTDQVESTEDTQKEIDRILLIEKLEEIRLREIVDNKKRKEFCNWYIIQRDLVLSSSDNRLAPRCYKGECKCNRWQSVYRLPVTSFEIGCTKCSTRFTMSTIFTINSRDVKDMSGAS